AASQARGEVKGSGLVNDSALEARADREGAMAARGESVTPPYGGASAPLSTSSAASAAGPMQAKSGKKQEEPKSKLQPELITEAEIEKTENGEKKSRVPYTPPSLGERIKNYFKNVLFEPHPIAFFNEPISVRERMSYENKHMWDTYDADEDAEIDDDPTEFFDHDDGLEAVYNLGRHDPGTANNLIYQKGDRNYVPPSGPIKEIGDDDTDHKGISENLIPLDNEGVGDFDIVDKVDEEIIKYNQRMRKKKSSSQKGFDLIF
ncbi:MAG: hypothetical protein IJI45_09085, partial [Anaerolineaceae bacterium]|nr:hypothetical protein [Anaerolineaceae bacterium]